MSTGASSGDLTGILQVAQRMQEAGELPEPAQGVLLEEAPLQKLEAFESLEDYAASNPMPDPLLEASETGDAGPNPLLEPAETGGASPNPLLEASEAGDPLPLPEVPSLSSLTSDAPPVLETSFATDSLLTLPDSPPSLPQPEALEENVNVNVIVNINSSDPPLVEWQVNSEEPFPTSGIAPSAATPPPVGRKESLSQRPKPKAPQTGSGVVSAAGSPLEPVRAYSEHLSATRATQAHPLLFQLLIEGPLQNHEKEKILDFLSSQNIGTSSADLEPQWEAQRLLLPQLSEFTAVSLVQLLRGSEARLRLRPAFEPSTASTEAPLRSPHIEEQAHWTSESQPQPSNLPPAHPADSLPITPLETPGPSGPSHWTPMTPLTATALLPAEAWEKKGSLELPRLLEALQRELQHKAYYKGASAVLHFKVELHPLSATASPAWIQVIVSGLAIRAIPNPNP